MRKFLLPVIGLALAIFLAGCQGFLEDYNYSPTGTMSSAGY